MIAGGEFHLLSGQNVTPAAGVWPAYVGTRPTAPEPQNLVWLLAEGGGRGARVNTSADLEGPSFISRTVTHRRVDRRYS
jgi:hypothetical protein